ncbi:homoendonuclease [Mycobacterium phage Gaia]|uniref:Homoendonuclease n=1 Tax=Mycobacterium phage Gaia TaxID=1486472 RepID=A0A068F3C6_9CAUD|nr:endonuclease VII [Mycobacterium phage Gaia]AID58838.1 homoendonuclease [Mycobacterium phage Gaia]AYR00108.1 HNH endonuclease [Mycobacterium phage Nebkiss]
MSGLSERGQSGPLAKDEPRGSQKETRDTKLWAKYKLTPEAYEKLLDKQGGGCAICGSKSSQSKGRDYLFVDHDHSCCPGAKSCGKCIRALLCHPCNMLIGHAWEDIKILQSAIDYLSEYAKQ